MSVHGKWMKIKEKKENRVIIHVFVSRNENLDQPPSQDWRFLSNFTMVFVYKSRSPISIFWSDLIIDNHVLTKPIKRWKSFASIYKNPKKGKKKHSRNEESKGEREKETQTFGIWGVRTRKELLRDENWFCPEKLKSQPWIG